jgi:Fe-S-cluster containining protein
MSERSSLTTLITQYQKLCQYCDALFAATRAAFRLHIRCSRGCATCCSLETVAPLEAYVMTSYLPSLPPHTISVLADKADQSTHQCMFLYNNECTLYPVRPIICRTHGLPIIYPDRQGIDTCLLNFSGFDLTSIDRRFLLDAETITMNLMRLNLAFCIITQKTESAGDRIPLQWLITGQYKPFKFEYHRIPMRSEAQRT